MNHFPSSGLASRFVCSLDNTKREDIVFIAIQFWLLGMSAVALLNESIPHIIASLLTHMLATAWSGIQIANTASFRRDFNHYITDGACAGVPTLLPNYWQQRANAEIPLLALNVAALLVSCVLTWKLVKVGINSIVWNAFLTERSSVVRLADIQACRGVV